MNAEQILATVRDHVEAGTVPGAVVGVDDGGTVTLAAAGTTGPDEVEPLRPDAPVRASSNTKPITAALTLALVADGVLALEEPITEHLPELAGQRVLREVEGAIDDTVPAERPATVEDLLTMRLGFGWVWDRECPTTDAFLDAGLGLGPPDPTGLPAPEEWLARFAEFPLLHQPGAAWRYDIAYLVLGALLSRAGGRPLPELLRDRVLEPLGLQDTSFVGAPVPQWRNDDGSLVGFDEGGSASRWATTPAFPDARGGLVSTAPDLLRFARALLDGGGGVLSPQSVAAMTTDHLSPEQRADPTAVPFLDGGGWGYGVGVVGTPAGPRYGWAGGLGTLWWSWPERDVAAVLVTQVTPPVGPVFGAFAQATAAALST